MDSKVKYDMLFAKVMIRKKMATDNNGNEWTILIWYLKSNAISEDQKQHIRSPMPRHSCLSRRLRWRLYNCQAGYSGSSSLLSTDY